MNILLKSVNVLRKTSPWHGKKADLGIKNGIITVLEEGGSFQEEAGEWDTIDCADYYVSIGWFDLRANFCDPGLEHKEDLESGAQAAAAGGFTEVALLPNTQPVIQTKNDVRYLKQFTDSPVVLHPVAAVTKDVKGDELTEMIDLNQAGAIAFSDGDHPLWNTQVMLKALQYMRKFNGLLINKPEDKYLNAFGTMHEGLQSTMMGVSGMPALAEAMMVERDLKLLAYVNDLWFAYRPRLHISTISTLEAVNLIRVAKKNGLLVTCDVAAHQLFFEDTALAGFDTNYKVNPPLRDRNHREALLAGLANGTIDAIVSSHSPHDEESKKCEFDLAEFGVIGLQTVFPILKSLSGKNLSLEHLIEKISIAPRQLLGMAIPELAKGATANLTLFSPDEPWKFDRTSNFSKSVNSPLFGTELTGKVLGVMNRKQYWMHHDLHQPQTH